MLRGCISSDVFSGYCIDVCKPPGLLLSYTLCNPLRVGTNYIGINKVCQYLLFAQKRRVFCLLARGINTGAYKHFKPLRSGFLVRSMV